ncbi:MAG: hypothetical protein KAS23_00400 [Anaerohalosphaera sp.]|nr:hypothetical protein [Anaerohalosphaera sp.]
MVGGNDGVVYSTEFGRMCPVCGRSADECVCGQEEAVFAGDGVVRIGRQTKGRKGKGVTVITGVTGTAGEIKRLARLLKAKCGAGGAVKDGVIEIQGDCREKVAEELRKMGMAVKLAGG